MKKQNAFLRGIKKYGAAYLFISPFFILFFIFQLFPMIWSVFLSFTEWDGLGEKEFIGFANYEMLFQDNIVLTAVGNTFYYWIFGLIFILFFSVVIALLLNYKSLRARTFFKSVAFLPYVCASVAMGLIFNMLFDYNAGLINELLKVLGMEAVPWLTSTSMSKIPPLILYIWRNVPWYSIIVLSGLLNIPADLYEAATVDGANAITQFFRITLPSLGDILTFCVLTLTVSSWQIFTEPFVMKGPASSNYSLSQYLYENAFTLFNMGYASAMGYILTLILLAFSVIQFRVMRRNNEV